VDAYLALVGKREVRRYEPRPIPDEVMARILEAGRATGSSRNRQPWRFIVVTDRARLRAVGALSARPANVELAPAAVIVAMLNPRAAFDAGRAAQNMMVAAWALDVGTCPNTPTDEAALKQLLGLPDDAIVPTILSLGYPAPDEPRPRPTADPAKVLARINRLPLAEVVHREAFRPRGAQSGMALLAVLVILMVVTTVAASLIWSMDQQQARAGNRLRAVAALAAAEAGMHRALAALESSAPDGRGLGRGWRPTDYTEEFQSGPLRGRFILSITDQPGGALAITSQGEIAGVTRRVRARVYLASPSMLAALYGAGLARIEKPPAQLIITTYGPIANQPWVHMAAGGGVTFGTTEAVINDPAARFVIGPGPIDAPGLAGSLSAQTEPARLVLPRGVDLTVGAEQRTVSAADLGVMGVRVDPRVVWTETFPQAPEIDRRFMQALAAGHSGNAALNDAAGKHLGDNALMTKRDSLYTEAQFAQLQIYLQTRPRSAATFHGVVYVTGPVALPENQRITILDGTLIAEGTVRLRWGASLEIIHSAATRALPGLIALQQGVAGQGALIVSQSARLRVHGLVHTDGTIDVWEGARVDVVGAVASTDPDLSFRNLGGSVVIRYDPAILGTPGLVVGDDGPVIAWVASWEELP